jgi:hypothetical protein
MGDACKNNGRPFLSAATQADWTSKVPIPLVVPLASFTINAWRRTCARSSMSSANTRLGMSKGLHGKKRQNCPPLTHFVLTP